MKSCLKNNKSQIYLFMQQINANCDIRKLAEVKVKDICFFTGMSWGG